MNTLSHPEPHKGLSTEPQEPKLQPEERPIPSPLEKGTPGTATAASLYLHDDVESQIQQQVTDKDSQYVGGKVSGPIYQPKDSTEREERRDIRQPLSLVTEYIPKLTATCCPPPPRPQNTATLPQPPNSLEEMHRSALLSKLSHGQPLRATGDPREDRQGPWVASNPWPNASHSVGVGPRPVHLAKGMSPRSSFSEKQELGAMILGLIQELIPPPPMQLLLSQAL